MYLKQHKVPLISICSLDEQLRLIAKEIQVDFSRSMNRITFDKIISSKPEKYPFVTLPQEEEEVVPNRGLYLRAGHSLRVVPNFHQK